MYDQKAIADFRSDRGRLEMLGVSWEAGVEPRAYLTDDARRDYHIAMDAQPGLNTDPNSAVPAMLTTLIDPEVYEILFSPNKGSVILGERRKGSWLDDTAMFPQVEQEGEVSSYGDFNNNGHAGANTNWPQRQSYLFQIIKEYGERELERAGLARINWVSEIDKSAATQLNKFSNTTYFFGVQGLQNYGLINDPNLPAPLTPGAKAIGGPAWYTGTSITATANEIFNDIQATIISVITSNQGLVDRESKFVLALSPQSEAALTQTNSFNVNVSDLLKKNFPNMRVVSAVQYGVLTASNPQGIAAGNLMQVIVENVEGQQTGYCAFNEKMRSFRIVPEMSSYKQKVLSGTFGAIVRYPVGFAQMLGI